MNTATQLILGAAALGLAGGLGFVGGRFLTPPIVVTEYVEDAEAARALPAQDNALELVRARTEIDALKAELRALHAEAETAGEVPPETETAPEVPARRPHKTFRSYNEYMANMKEENPQRYAEMLDYRRRVDDAKSRAFAERDEFLREIDISLLPPTVRRDHLVYIDTLRRYESLTAEYRRITEDGGRPSEELQRSLRESNAAIHRLRSQERTVLMQAVAKSAGLDAQSADDLVRLVDSVYSATGSHLKYTPRPAERKTGRNAAR